MKHILSTIVFVTILVFSFDVNANLPFKTQMSDNYEVIVFLKDGRTIEGVLLQRTVENILLETDFGEITIRSENIERIELKGTSEQIPHTERRETERDEIRDPDLESEVAMIGRAMVYESRKKNIGTAIGFEALGAGLLYAERYAAGSIMLLAQTGLLAGAIFADDPDVQIGLGIGALALKATNLFFTIRAVNRYNQNLMYDLGLQDRPESRIRSTFNIPSHALYIIALGRTDQIGLAYEYRLRANWSISGFIGTTLIDDYDTGNNNIGFSMHYLIGNHRNKLELGIGSIIYSGDVEEWIRTSPRQWEVNTSRERNFFINPIFGYRYESKGNILFRSVITTIGSVGYPNRPTAYDVDPPSTIGFPILELSFGYSF